jgi:hypothetical protein
LLSKDVNRQLHDQLEKTGNIRIDRVAFGFAPSRVKNSQKIFFRITGKGNPAWLADVMASSSPGLAFSKRKTADGVSIVTLSSQFGGAGAFLSDTDLLFVGERSGQANQDLIDEMLEYRDKKKPGAAAGVLKDRLAKIPDHAIAIAVCDLPAEGRKNLSHLVDPFPAKISAYAERTPQGFDLKAETLAADATEAGKLAKSIGAMRKESIKSIQEAMKQPEPGAPAPPYPMIINLLESIQVQSDEQKVNLRGLAPAGLLERLVGPAMYYDPPRGFLSPRGPRYR